jgi:phosphohistidine phosphatase
MLMLLYLVRHAKAGDGADDALRELTPQGEKAALRIAHALERGKVHVDRVQHSGLVRARQTAEILQRAVGGRIEVAPDLSPSEDVLQAARRLEDESGESLMLVGHLPFMGRLAGYLLTGDRDADILHFRTASVACLSGAPREGWQLEWFLEPDLV